MSEESALGRRKVGTVTEEERDEIKTLFERKSGLVELVQALASLSSKDLETSGLYERIVKDMGETTVKFKKWWDTKSASYGWENLAGHIWEIDFETKDIFIKKS